MTLLEAGVTVEAGAERPALTASLAIRLAEEALNAGQVRSAICYVNLAYAIFDSGAGCCGARTNASRWNVGRT